jgi:hypothetical protein
MSAYPSTGRLAAIAAQQQRELRSEGRLRRAARIAGGRDIEDTGLHWTDVKHPTWVRVPCLHHRSGRDKQLTVADSRARSGPVYQA